MTNILKRVLLVLAKFATTAISLLFRYQAVLVGSEWILLVAADNLAASYQVMYKASLSPVQQVSRCRSQALTYPHLVSSLEALMLVIVHSEHLPEIPRPQARKSGTTICGVLLWFEA